MLLLCTLVNAQTTPSGNSFNFIDDSPILSQSPQLATDNCNSSSSNACPFDNAPTKYIKMDLHFVCKANGSGNFNEYNDGNYPNPKPYNAYQRAEDLIKEANRQLVQNTKLNTPNPPSPPVCKINIQLVLGDVIVHREKNLVEDTKDINGTWNPSASFKYANFTYNSTPSYSTYFYPINNVKKTVDIGGYTDFGANQIVAYGNWTSYKEQLKTNDPWYFPINAQNILHELFHTNGQNHPKDGNDNCDDTYQYPNVYDSGTNNLMDYHGNSNWGLSPCQLCRIHSSYETSYDLSLVELDNSNNPITATNITKTINGEVGKINVEQVLGASIAIGKSYKITIKVKNTCGETEISKTVKVKNCDWNTNDTPQPIVNKIDKVNIYPNPTLESLNIEYNVIESTNTKIDVINVQNPSLSFSIKSLRIEDIGDKYYFSEIPYEYPEGQYFVRIFSDETVITKSIFYQK